MLNTLVHELHGVEAEFDALERRRESLRQAVSGLQGVLGVNADDEDEDENVPDPALRPPIPPRFEGQALPCVAESQAAA